MGFFNGKAWCFLLLLAVGGSAAGEELSSPTVLEASVQVDIGGELHPVNRLIFGQNIEAADGRFIDNKDGKPMPLPTGTGFWDTARREPVPNIVDEARRLGVSVWRYPGGSLAKGFDWHKAVGPPEARPDYAFGIPEFLDLCKATGAEPLMTVSDYAATPDDAAALVEFLNAPADANYPWAMKRAEWGHPEPWNVSFFEMGNESDTGNAHFLPHVQWSADDYVRWFNEAARKMKAVDPSIRIGALLGTKAVNRGPFAPWNRIVAAGVSDTADFLIIHIYPVGLWSPDAPNKASSDLLMRAAMAAVNQCEVELGQYRDVVRAAAGKDIPFAITEYNAEFVQSAHDPIQYRMSWGAALFCADYIRILLQPRSDVLMANYWQMLNGYWGFLRGPVDVNKVAPADRVWTKYPAYEIFRLWAEHLGTTLVPVTVDSPRLPFEGYLDTRTTGENLPADGGAPPTLTLDPKKLISGAVWEPMGTDGGRLTLSNYAGETYPRFGRFNPVPGVSYRVTFEARVTGEATTLRLGLGLVDGRGWDATRSAIAIPGLEATHGDWEAFEGDMPTLPDAQEIAFIWRLINVSENPVNGVAEIRNLKVTPIAPLPPYPILTATATLSSDGQTLHLIVINKHQQDAVSVQFKLPGFTAKEGKVWTLTAPALEAVQVGPGGVQETVSGARLDGVEDGGFQQTFPPRSMSAIDLSR